MILSKQNSAAGRKLFRYRDGILPNMLLFFYLALLSLAIVWLFPAAGFWSWLGASLLLAHWLVLLAYLVHDLMHGSIFRDPVHNQRLGTMLCWLLGAGYIPYNRLKEKHLRHHTERMDVLAVDYRPLLDRFPRLGIVIRGMEKLCLSGVEWFTRLLSMLAPFYLEQQKALRGRVLVVLVSRLLFFIGLFAIHWSLLAAWWFANTLCIWVLGFMDCFQHTYETRLSLSQPRQPPQHTRDFEEQHTYSNLLSGRFTWLNLLVLNFCYHNVHHWRSGEPWHRLPALHQHRYPRGTDRTVSLGNQLRYYYRYRQVRSDTDSSGSIEPQKLGAAGVSFLVGV